ncbi:hypothetical protein XENOCAPTIV_029274 [Xenoophorus captivus]|uniref:Pseudouridine synthase RsuA/RluA-like domain-containing protein n=1 Tax=Xenoophorus captivus TaxID=1517983 RepID=A0ABV0RC18_9TELE
MSSDPASIESLHVLYQSDDYIIVDKHWDIRIDSKMWYEKQTVQMQLQHHFPLLADPSTYYGFRSYRCKAASSLFDTTFVYSGRTHQLRVHCSAIGHPIVGDFTYSLGADDSPYRMMLHAYFLHIPLEPQHLLVTAGDPFVPAVDPKWVSQRLLRTLNATIESILEQRKTKEKEREVAKREEERKKKSKQPRVEEQSEEQRRACQEWLSEWAGD